MEIVKININDITPYEKNAKIHTPEQIEQIKNSILEFGNNDPIAVDENNVIIEGHGRYEALKQLGYKEVEIIKLEHMTEEQKKAYMLVHNKLTMNTDFDLDLLGEELNDILNIDMADFGFADDLGLDLDEDEGSVLTDEKYTTKVDIPQYQITGENPDISELVNTNKSEELITKIKSANITDEQKKFLIKASKRHDVFNYSKIAEYYAHQNKEMQELMEQSALVIIDFDDAIKNGYAYLSKEIDKMYEEDEKYEE